MATTGEVAELRREQSVPIPHNKDSEYGAKPERRVRKFAPLRHGGESKIVVDVKGSAGRIHA